MSRQIDKGTIDHFLSELGKHLTLPTQLCVIGSGAAILSGQPDRQTPDLDIWHQQSDFDSGDLRQACEACGMLYDPKEDVDPDAVYLQIIRPALFRCRIISASNYWGVTASSKSLCRRPA